MAPFLPLSSCGLYANGTSTKMAEMPNGTIEPSDAEIQVVIADILREGELSQLTSRTVRLQIEKKLGVSLVERKKDIDNMLMEMILQKTATENQEEEKNERERNKETKEKNGNEEEGSDSSDDSLSEDEEPAPMKRKQLKGTKEDKSTVEDAELAKMLHQAENGRCLRSSTKKQSAQLMEKATKTKANRKSTSFTKQLVLSPLLAELVGHDRMSRCEVVKSIWKIIRERNLEDPVKKNFAICDEQFEQLFGLKRFKTFAMMKYLQNHMKDPNYLS